MRPTERVNGEEARRGVLAGVLEQYRAIFRDPATPPAAAPGPDPISQWAATEYGEGPSLAAIVELLGPLSAEAVAALALDAVAQLTELHAAGSVHGDLNPSNVLLADGGARLIHAGIAHTIDGATLTDLRGNPRTVAYLTPEQILGQPFGAAADVFALGGILAFAAVGVPAFGNDEPNAVLYRIVHEEAVLDAVPDVLRGLVKACLSKDPAQRPALQTLGDRACGAFTAAVAAQQKREELGEFGEPEALAPDDEAIPAGPAFPEPVPAEQTAAYEPIFDPVFDQDTDPRIEPLFEGSAPPQAAPFEAAAQTQQFDPAQFAAQTPIETLFDQSFDPAFDPSFDSAFDAPGGPDFSSAADPAGEQTSTVVTLPSGFPDPELTLTEVPLRDPFESTPTRRHPRYEPLSELSPDAAAQPTMTADPVIVAPPPPRRRSRSTTLAVFGTIVVIGVAAAFVVRAATHSNTPAAVTPPASVPVMPTSALPGTFLTGPGCPSSPWAAVTQAVAPDGGLVQNAGGGAAQCGGMAIAFVKSGATNPGASSVSWTFHLGWSARCTLSVFIAGTAPSSGFATYQVFVPASASTVPSATFRINQAKTKGQWVAPPQLTDLAMPDGTVQLRLTDAGAFTGDRFHVTASAVKAVCSQAP